MTTNRSLLGSVTKFDAIVFVLNNKRVPKESIVQARTYLINKNFFRFRFPKRRSPHQLYVMFMMESPLYTNAAKFPTGRKV